MPECNIKIFTLISLYSIRTWSQVGRSINDGWPESTNDSENKDWSVGQQSAPTSAYSDLVQEFEPGKPWKVSLLYYLLLLDLPVAIELAMPLGVCNFTVGKIFNYL